MHHRLLTWAFIGSACAFATCAMAASGTSHRTWVEAWAASPDTAGPALDAQTVRQVVRASIGGSAVRVRLSNLFGNAAIPLGPVHVALSAGGADTVRGSDHTLLFNGDRKSTRLNSSHHSISYAVFCLKKKK